jgi:hypothetical protein
MALIEHRDASGVQWTIDTDTNTASNQQGSRPCTAQEIALVALYLQQEADLVAQRVPAGNRIDLLAKATQAIDLNLDFLNLTTPSNAQVLAQVRLLTRETTALIRLLTEALDSTDGT